MKVGSLKWWLFIGVICTIAGYLQGGAYKGFVFATIVLFFALVAWAWQAAKRALTKTKPPAEG